MTRTLLFAGMLIFSLRAFGLPEFAGARNDDSPVFEGFLTEAHAKNLHAGIVDISNVVLDEDHMLIRLYAGFGRQPFPRGGYPLDVKELHIAGDKVTMLWYPVCQEGPERPTGSPDTAWQTLQEQDFFNIRDYRTFPDYPLVMDGVTYLVQIKTASAYREFVVSNPQEYSSDDNRRLLTSVNAIADEFGVPGCYRP